MKTPEYVSKALVGEYVGIEELEEQRLKIWFRDFPLCTVESLLMRGQHRIYVT